MRRGVGEVVLYGANIRWIAVRARLELGAGSEMLECGRLRTVYADVRAWNLRTAAHDSGSPMQTSRMYS